VEEVVGRILDRQGEYGRGVKEDGRGVGARWEVGGDGDTPTPLLRGLSAQLSAVEGGSGYQVSLS